MEYYCKNGPFKNDEDGTRQITFIAEILESLVKGGSKISEDFGISITML